MNKFIMLGIVAGLVTVSSAFAADDTVMCTAQYDPVCAEKQVQCFTTPCNPIRQTYSNSCMAGADNATVVYQGECEEPALDEPKFCTKEYNPVCDKDGNSYGNPCMAQVAGLSEEEYSKDYCDPTTSAKQELVLWANGLGMTKFPTLGQFDFDAFVTREQAAKMIVTAIKRSGAEIWAIKQPDGSCVWTDTDWIDNSLREFADDSCRLGLLKGFEGKFMAKAYLTDTDAMTIMVRASQYIPALADYLARVDFVPTTNTPLTRGQLVTRLHDLVIMIQESMVAPTPEVDYAQAQKDLDTARNLWSGQHISSYTFIQTRSCFCPTDYTRAMMYSIVDGKISTNTLVYADDQTKVSVETEVYTVDQVFDLIQKSIDDKVANLTVEYDTTYGYPTIVTIDKDFMIADEEQYFSFKLITSNDVVFTGNYVLDSFNNKKVSNTGITLSFTPDRVSAKVCNNIGGTYTATSGTITFGSMMSTMMACMDDEIMKLESEYGMMTKATYTKNANSLTLTSSGNVWAWIRK